MEQCIVVVEVFVTQRQPVDALLQQTQVIMDTAGTPPLIGQYSGHCGA